MHLKLTLLRMRMRVSMSPEPSNSVNRPLVPPVRPPGDPQRDEDADYTNHGADGVPVDATGGFGAGGAGGGV